MKRKRHHQDFWKIVDTTFTDMSLDHKMAIFKRCTTLLILDHRVVLRLPSERVDKEIFVYDEEGICDNIIPESAHKEYLGRSLEGENEEYEGYREAKQEEDEWAKEFLSRIIWG